MPQGILEYHLIRSAKQGRLPSHLGSKDISMSHDRKINNLPLATLKIASNEEYLFNKD